MTAKTVQELITKSVPSETAAAYMKLRIHPRGAATERGLIDWVVYTLFNCSGVKSLFCKGKDKHLSIKVRNALGQGIATVHLPLGTKSNKGSNYGFIGVPPTIVEFANGETWSEVKGENGHDRALAEIFGRALADKDAAKKALSKWKLPIAEDVGKAIHESLVRSVMDNMRAFNQLVQVKTNTEVLNSLTVYIYHDPLAPRMSNRPRKNPENNEWSYAVTKTGPSGPVFVQSCSCLKDEAAALEHAKFNNELKWTDKQGVFHRNTVTEVIHGYPSTDILMEVMIARHEKTFLNVEKVTEYLERMAGVYNERDDHIFPQWRMGRPIEMVDFYSKRSKRIRKGAEALREITQPRTFFNPRMRMG